MCWYGIEVKLVFGQAKRVGERGELQCGEFCFGWTKARECATHFAWILARGRGGGGLYRSVLTRPVAVRLWKHYGMPTCVLLGKLLNKDPWIKDTSLTWFCPILIQIRDTLKFHNRHLFLVHIPLVSSFLSPSPLFFLPPLFWSPHLTDRWKWLHQWVSNRQVPKGC